MPEPSPVSLSEDADSKQKDGEVVGGVHALTAVTFGSAYAFSAVFPGLSTEFDASRGEIALVFSISAFVFYSLGAIAGPLADRWSSRGLIMVGLIAMIIGYAEQAGHTPLASLYAWYGAGVGLGIGLSYVPALGAVQSPVRPQAQPGIGHCNGRAWPLHASRCRSRSAVLPYFSWRGCFILLACIIAVIGLTGLHICSQATGEYERTQGR